MFHRFHTGTWQRHPSGRVPTRFIPVRVARATVTMAVLRICALLLLFDCQEAFHCCLVVACINRINMISIECHRSGERCPGKREFDNRIEINRVRSGEIDVAIPFNFTLVKPKCPCHRCGFWQPENYIWMPFKIQFCPISSSHFMLFVKGMYSVSRSIGKQDLLHQSTSVRISVSPYPE